jgi:hypothetical protein
MRASRSRTLLYPVFAALLAFGAVSQQALAQPDQKPTKEQEQAAAKFQQLQIEDQKVRIQLGQIEQKAIAGDKKLQTERQQFSQHLMQAMQTIGYDPEGDSKQLDQIKQSIDSGKLSQQERAAQIQKFQAIRARLMQGQMTVMQEDKTLQEENRKLNETTIAAMKKQDPHTDALLKRLKEINQQLQRMYEAAQPHKK